MRNPETLRQICADRPDLVQYLESLLTEATASGLASNATQLGTMEGTAFSSYHIRWQAFIGKTQPHLERCKKWRTEVTITPNSAAVIAPAPQPTWTDTELSIKVLAAQGGDLNIQAQWHYGPPGDGLNYNCHLYVEGWDLMLNLNWLKRSLYTMFYHEPEITLMRATMTDDTDALEDGEARDHVENIGGLG